MAKMDTRYDEDNATMWVYRTFEEAETLVPNDELQSWTKRLEGGETDDGRPLKRVNYVFGDEATAEYNHQPLRFAKLGVYVGDLDDPSRYESSEGDPDFDTREDFGIE